MKKLLQGQSLMRLLAMEAREHQMPDPSKTERVGHPENLNHSLSDDVPQWYHPTVSARQEEKSRKGWPPALVTGRQEK